MKYFLVQADGYYYCVPHADLSVNDAALVKVGQTVPFKYGTMASNGDVVLIASKEKEVLSEIKRLKKADRKRKREVSFYEDRPRKAVLKNRMDDGMTSSQTKRQPESSPADSSLVFNKAQKKKDIDNLKDVARKATEDTLFVLDAANRSSRPSSTSSSSPSDASSIVVAKKSGTEAAAIATLKSLQSSSSSLGLDGSMNELADKEHVANAEANDGDPIVATISGENSDDPLAREETIPIGDLDDADDDGVLDYDSECKTKKRRKSKKRSKGKGKKRSRKSRSKHRKHSRKHRRRRFSSDSSSSSSTSSTSSTSSSSSCSSDSRTDGSPAPASKRVKRNNQTYPGVNYNCKADDEGVEKLHQNYEVYVLSSSLQVALNSSKSVTQFIRMLVDKVYTREALLNATPLGFPVRNRGKKYMRRESVMPRLHPDGRDAILARARELEDEKKSWRPRVGSAKTQSTFSGKCSEYRASH